MLSAVNRALIVWMIWVVSERGDFCWAVAVESGTEKTTARVMVAIEMRCRRYKGDAPEEDCYDYIGRTISVRRGEMVWIGGESSSSRGWVGC